MLSVEEALELIAKFSRPLAPRKTPLNEVAGRVLAEDVVSDTDSPPYDKSLMDGYAVRSSDRQPERRVLEEVAAGSVPQLPLSPGTATRIMTGAPLPEGADAVVAFEQTEPIDNATIRLQLVDPPPGRHILHRGEALKAGDRVLRAGALIRPIEIAILAEIGRDAILAYPGPRVAILPTGNELVPVGKTPSAGQIRNSNGPMLRAAAERFGAVATELDIAPDNRDALRSSIEKGLAADVLVLSGGVSVGDFDLVPSVLAELGVEQVLHKVALRPGKPLWFGVKQDGNRTALVFGLPGNPMSSFVCFELFVRPALAALAGRGFTGAETKVARLTHSYDHSGVRSACLPARMMDQAGSAPTVEILPWHGSADLASVARANALARIPAKARQYPAGAELEVVVI